MENADTTQRMNAGNKPDTPASTGSAPHVSAPAPPATLSADSLAAAAANLATSATLAKAQSAASLSLNLPEFRESSPQEIQRAEQLLREANLLRRREKYREAEAKCREALALVPKYAAALELLGDLLQGVARVDEALAAYKRATEADPKRATAERKYADLLMRQQNWAAIDLEAVQKKPWVSVLLSLLLPGAGQIHNGETIKGLLLIAGTALCFLGWILFGSLGAPVTSGAKQPAPAPKASRRGQAINWGTMIPLVIGSAIYIYALIDANAGAQRASFLGARVGGKTGWEV